MGLRRRRIKTTPTTAAPAAVAATDDATGGAATTTCGCLRTLMRKVKKQGKQILYVRKNASCSLGLTKCYNYNYDPQSYSLNFDSGSLLHEEDYYHHFCAFSSRYAAASAAAPRPTPALLVAASH